MNGWLFRCAETSAALRSPHFPGCVHAQHKERIHSLGTQPPFAARSTNFRNAGQSELSLRLHQCQLWDGDLL
jgi:hypothetical protein